MQLEPDDATLVSRIAAGDRAALGHVYARESGRVYRYALAMTHNAEVAADVTQDTFMNFARNCTKYDATRGPLQAYLVGITRHAVLSTWQVDKRYVDQTPEELDEPGNEADPSDALISRESSAQLMAALARLPAMFREAIVLVELQEYSYIDAARIAGIELNTLRTRLFRAKQKLVKLLAEDGVAPNKVSKPNGATQQKETV